MKFRLYFFAQKKCENKPDDSNWTHLNVQNSSRDYFYHIYISHVIKVLKVKYKKNTDFLELAIKVMHISIQ